MAYWLFKSEPNTWSWDDQVARGDNGEHWDGVRNYLANKNMKFMRVGDLGFFYHSVNEKRIIGIVKVIKEHYPDHTDSSGRFGMVDIAAVCPLPNPVALSEIKEIPELAEAVLVNNSRLSVQPITQKEWAIICSMGGINKPPLCS